MVYHPQFYCDGCRICCNCSHEKGYGNSCFYSKRHPYLRDAFQFSPVSACLGKTPGRTSDANAFPTYSRGCVEIGNRIGTVKPRLWFPTEWIFFNSWAWQVFKWWEVFLSCFPCKMLDKALLFCQHIDVNVIEQNICESTPRFGKGRFSWDWFPFYLDWYEVFCRWHDCSQWLKLLLCLELLMVFGK